MTYEKTPEKPRRQMSLRFEDEILRKDDSGNDTACSNQGSFAKKTDDYNIVMYGAGGDINKPEEGDDILTYEHKGTPRTINLTFIKEEKDGALNKIQQDTNPWHWPEPLANPCDLSIIHDDNIE